ncbi:methionyl-tRNA formyltransferase [Candidatus Poribacteria bacterium]|nr:methionyl-tRNA formyltransferase [Candidatus Poribacteria bacterium]
MQLVFMGTSEFAVPTLETLVSSEHNLSGVVTQPDRASGRGQKLMPSAVKKAALAHELSIYQPERVRDAAFIQILNQLNPEAIVIAAYGQILPKRVLDIPPYGCINIHPSLLPKYRGAAPIQRAIINGERTTGVTIMLMDEGEDTGDIILQTEVEIFADDTAITLHDKLAQIAADLLLKALALAKNGPPPHYPQNESEATYAPKLTKEDGLIDWSKSAIQIRNLVRGTLPWPEAYTYFGEGKLLKILSCEFTEIPMMEVTLGTIYITDEKEVAVKTGEGAILLKTVQPANKQPMNTKDFINGYRIKTGDQLDCRLSIVDC